MLVRPVVPQHPLANNDSVADPVPELRLEIPPLPPPLAMRPAPTKPRGVAPAANQTAPAGRLDAPQIVPDLSAKESASLRRETDQSLSAAERNLAAIAGKSLNAAQTDLVSKVRSFISDAGEAARAGDWSRARDLAKKAQVLSEELGQLP